MPITPEERARIARENGAKSRGPKSPEGKAASRLNSIKTGEHTTTLAQFVPPQSGILCHEDRKQFFALVQRLTHIYLPINDEAADLVRQIAIARWTIDRLQTNLNTLWNHELMVTAQQPLPVPPEHEDDFIGAQSALNLFAGKSAAQKIERHIDQLQRRIARCRREIILIHKQFPNADKPLETQDQQPNQEPTANQIEPTVYVTETTPEVLAAYRREFPNHKIIVLPADDVANGVDIKDDLPPAPRRAA